MTTFDVKDLQNLPDFSFLVQRPTDDGYLLVDKQMKIVGVVDFKTAARTNLTDHYPIKNYVVDLERGRVFVDRISQLWSRMLLKRGIDIQQVAPFTIPDEEIMQAVTEMYALAGKVNLLERQIEKLTKEITTMKENN